MPWWVKSSRTFHPWGRGEGSVEEDTVRFENRGSGGMTLRWWNLGTCPWPLPHHVLSTQHTKEVWTGLMRSLDTCLGGGTRKLPLQPQPSNHYGDAEPQIPNLYQLWSNCVWRLKDVRGPFVYLRVCVHVCTHGQFVLFHLLGSEWSTVVSGKLWEWIWSRKSHPQRDLLGMSLLQNRRLF